MKDKKFSLVWNASGQLDAEMIKNLLASFNIESFSFEESAGIIYGFTNTPLGEVEIYVKSSEKKAADEILLAYDQGQLEEA